jgi:hypothetical protein
MIYVELSTWMRPVQPVNSELTFSLLGRVTHHAHTDALIHDNGRRYLYCKRHHYVYLPSEQCPRCLMERIP